MPGCDILDWRCVFVNELVGTATLAVLVATVLFFIFASRIKIGFRTTVVLSIPLILILGLAISSFPILFAFITILAGFLLATIFQKLIGN